MSTHLVWGGNRCQLRQSHLTLVATQLHLKAPIRATTQHQSRVAALRAIPPPIIPVGHRLYLSRRPPHLHHPIIHIRPVFLNLHIVTITGVHTAIHFIKTATPILIVACNRNANLNTTTVKVMRIVFIIRVGNRLII